MGIEPTSSAWKAEVLPLNYTRLVCVLVPFSGTQKFRQSLLIRRRSNCPNLNILYKVPSKRETAFTVTLQKALVASRETFKPSTVESVTNKPTCYTRSTATFHRVKLDLVEGVGFEPT